MKREEGEEVSVRINGQSISEFWGGHWYQRWTMLSPFFVTNTAGMYSVMCTVKGGGLVGQAEAIRHGVATAMQGYDIVRYRPTLKAAGFLRRDPRVKEPKKPGQPRARKKKAWVKR